MSEEKTCTACGNSLPLKAFHRDRLGKHDKKAACKNCRCIREQERSRALGADQSEADKRRTRAAIYASPCALADGDCFGEVLDHCPDDERPDETLPICKRHRAWVGRLERTPTYARLVSLFKFRRRF